MLSSQTPTILAKNGKVVLVTGSPGGRTIINTVLNIVVNVVDYEMPIQQAVDAPRLHHQWFPDELKFEGTKQHAETVEPTQGDGPSRQLRSPGRRSLDLGQSQDRRLRRRRRQTAERKGSGILRNHRTANTRRGITVLEVLVVVVLCICVVGLGVMLLARHRENSLREQCKLNLMHMGEAFQSYHDLSAVDKKLQRLPPARIAEGYGTWAVLLAPYLTKDHPLQGWDQEQSYFKQKDEVREARSYSYFCPSRRRSDTLSTAGDVDAANKFFPGALG